VRGGDAHHLAEDLALRRGSPYQFIQLAYVGQQRRQRPSNAVACTDTEQVLGAGIEADDGAVGIDDQDRGRQTAKNFRRRRRRDGALRLA
jgi:hypothetical protein